MKTNNINKRQFLTCNKITNGLYITMNQNKVKRNCKLYDLCMKDSLGIQHNTKISKRGNIAIISIQVNTNIIIQYKIASELNLNGLDNIQNDLLPKEIKNIVIDSHQLLAINTLRDLIHCDKNM